ncbi:MAG: PrsW family glutamic-type intramembrane protease [Candidatus Saccharibacteria bacterium]|nr:PrsW family glutamic-type intramembrane protease [Candidatus Saccharibacteria bacterium]
MDNLIYVAVLPIVLLLSFIYKKDPHPEGKKLLKKVFGFGCLACVPVIICELLYDFLAQAPEIQTYEQIFINTLLGVGLVEEFFKWIVIWWLCYRNKDFDETYDAIVYASYSSLGFACIENILYVLTSGMLTGIFRAITSVPGHLCFGVIMGYFLGKARLSKARGKSSTGYIILSIVAPTVIHTLYDFFLLAENDMLVLVWLAFIVIMFILCFILVSHSSKRNEPINDAITAQNAAGISPIAPANNTGVTPSTPAMSSSPVPSAPVETMPTPTSASIAEPTPALEPAPTPVPEQATATSATPASTPASEPVMPAAVPVAAPSVTPSVTPLAQPQPASISQPVVDEAQLPVPDNNPFSSPS